MNKTDSIKIEKGIDLIHKEQFQRENKLRKFFITYGLLFFLLFLFIVFTILIPRFATTRNVVNLLSQGSIIGLLALGLTNIIICGEFDISFAAIAALCSILSVMVIGEFEIPLLFMYLLVFVIGIFVSVINGIFIVYGNMPSFITTLGMRSILVGVSKWLTSGSIKMYSNLPEKFKILGRSKIAGIFPVSLLIFFISALLAAVFLELTFKGRNYYAVGSNLEAARRVGINIKKTKFESFIIMGIVASFGGIVMGSLFSAANASLEQTFLFPTIITVFLGAVFLREGIPNVFGTFIAAILMSEIANGFTMLGFSLWVKEVVQAIILIIAVSFISILKPGGIPNIKL
jgi:ribose transport system permease protein